MKFDQNAFDILRNRYGIRNIEMRYAYGAEDEVRMELSPSSLALLVKDLLCPPNSTLDVRDIFSVIPLESQHDNTVYIAKYPIGKYPYDMIAEYGPKLKEKFCESGYQLILMPDIIDVSTYNAEQLIQMRDELNILIQNLNYDSIIGF